LHSCGKARPDEVPAQLLAEVLSADGYVATIQPAGAGQQICQHNCPVAEVAKVFLDVIDSSLSHRVKSRGARCIGKLSKGRYRQVVVGSVIVGTPVIGQEEHAGRSAPSASSKDLLLTGIDETPTHKSCSGPLCS
jgi:hypothetical protein